MLTYAITLASSDDLELWNTGTFSYEWLQEAQPTEFEFVFVNTHDPQVHLSDS